MELLQGQEALAARRRSGCDISRVLSDPCVIAAGGDIQDAAHHSNGVTGPVLAHELEPFGGITSVSRANQAAAFERMSRSDQLELGH